MKKQEIITAINSYQKGFLSNKPSVQRRIEALADIEFAAQQARENLEAILDDIDETREPITFGYYRDGEPRTDADQEYAERVSTCKITPLYTAEDITIFLQGGK